MPALSAVSLVPKPDEPPKTLGRPKKLLTPKEISDLERLAETGATQQEQAMLLGISVDTLQRRLLDQPEVYEAMCRANARMRTSIRRKQIAVALDDKHPAQATMLIWCGKVLLGQSDRVTLKIETPQDAFDKLKLIWPEIDSDELIKQLTAGPEAIDAEVVGAESESEERTA